MGCQKRPSRQVRVKGAADEINTLLSAADYGGENFALEQLTDTIQSILKDKTVANAAAVSLVKDCFDTYDKQYAEEEQERQFEVTERFIFQEQNSGARRREQARLLEAQEELRLKADIAQLKGFRQNTRLANAREEVQRKISDAERAYFSRKMMVSRASQVANSECRQQFTRVREFFKEIHDLKEEALKREHKRNLRRMEIVHRLNDTDARVQALEKQIADRVYKKKLQDLNELHIAQNMEEAIYMESMLELLEKVHEGKENAAKEIFELTVKHLKERQASECERAMELEKFQADSLVEIDEVIAAYVKDDKLNEHELQKTEEEVDAIERRKDFKAAKRQMASVGDLYDAVLWSVVKNHTNLTSSNSDFSSEISLDADEDPLATVEAEIEEATHYQTIRVDDGSSSLCGSIDSNDGSVESSRKGTLSPAGNMHVRQITRDLRNKEKAIIQRHEKEYKQQRRSQREAMAALKKKHTIIVEGLIQNCLYERQNLREGIETRLAELASRQEASTQELRETVQKDGAIMQEALKAEDKRVENAETEGFAKAQTMISAQVFHEVRNALSSVIAMSDIARHMKNDPNVSGDQLVTSVEEMLGQINEVVDYALKMLNNVLDISKITSGTFQVQSTPFDLQDLVCRATRMQKAKAGKIKMSFVPNFEQPAIAFADPDILVRIVTNLISNSLKFTSTGGVQPFICPIEDIAMDEHDIKDMELKNRVGVVQNEKSELDITNTKKRLVAVGVADTGNGLSKIKLKSAEMDFSTCDSQSSEAFGVRNSGFGLHLIHLLSKVLGSRLQLSSLEKCRKVLSKDMLDAIDERDLQRSDSGSRSVDVAGKGSVLFVTLPVYEDGENARRALKDWTYMRRLSERSSSLEIDTQRTFSFAPRPRDSGCFRILVADDVLMLRKGMANALTNIFTACPVSISTCCTAEDVIRAVRNNPFDLIICDNLFHHDVSKWRRIEDPEERARFGRPNFTFDARVHPKKEIREKLSGYFKTERFTLEEGDGEMTGHEAMLAVEAMSNPEFPTPVLMILSGQKLEVPKSSGIMVAQKPLNQSDFIGLLERSAPKLIQTGYCREDICSDESAETASLSDSERGDNGSEAPSSADVNIQVVLNGHGTQLFVSHRQ